ncbi:MAG: RecQ family ATP-dependent DNA helicase, partial [Myxococcaceae bacterium]
MRRMTEPLRYHEDARAELERHFALKTFRPGQAEVIDSVLAGRNVVVVMPTGAGKSLCYQLPAVMLKGLTLVVSPLIALMKDQVEQLEARGIPATLINSTIPELERAERIRKMRAGAYRLVYVAPERFRSPSFVDALGEVGVELLAVDEAHCISQWGHDFRPDYALLGQVRKRLRPPRTVALTATASPEVREDIVKSLLMKDPRVFVAGFDRPNLFLEVLKISGDEERRAACAQVIAEGGSGIVYCATRKQADAMQGALRLRGHDPVVYHAGMDEAERHKAQDRFMGDPSAVAVATNAFGMGIDKPDIRFVIHANIPRAVEAYYQEVGRAGRDGRPATALLLFNHADVFTQQRLIAMAMEPRACAAVPQPFGGDLTLYSSTQIPHILKVFVALTLAIPEQQIRVVAPAVGGGFGSKLEVYAEEFLVVGLARKHRVPVRWVEERTENAQAAVQGRGQIQEMELAADSDGRLTAVRVNIIADMGGYQQLITAGVPLLGAFLYAGVYDIPQAYSFTCTGVYTTMVPTDAYRGAGRPEATYAIERSMDRLAQISGIDPVELRRRNF